MNIHEHQAKALLAQYGVKVPNGYPAFTVDEAVLAAGKLEGDIKVVKAQIHAGGRGKAGGVKVVTSIEAVRSEAQEMLGKTLVTHQTGPAGKQVQRLYIEEGCQIERELYLSMLIDRATSQVSVICSTEGGMDIEAVAAETPEKILALPIKPSTAIKPHHIRRVIKSLGLTGAAAKKATLGDQRACRPVYSTAGYERPGSCRHGATDERS